MDKLGPSPFVWMEFDKDGGLIDPTVSDRLTQALNDCQATDLVVISHGWNNQKADAQSLYEKLWGFTVKALKKAAGSDPARIVVCGILWPATEFPTTFDTDAAVSSDTKATLALGTAAPTKDLSKKEFDKALKNFSTVFGHGAAPVVEAARTAASGNLVGAKARNFVSAGKAMIDLKPDDTELNRDGLGLRPEFAETLLAQLVARPHIAVSPQAATTLGLGANLTNFIQGPRAAVARYLNYLTYYTMKARAGVVGAALGATAFPKVKPANTTQLHLIGHSFGARLVSAAAEALPASAQLPLRSLTLLQGAFSHNGYRSSAPTGAFPDVVGKPSGPISITHTHNDLACTIMYALASRLVGDNTMAVGDKDDPFGAMGANGPQGLAPDSFVADVTSTKFAPVAGKVNTFLADSYVVAVPGGPDAHNNVATETTGKLVAAVLQVG